MASLIKKLSLPNKKLSPQPERSILRFVSRRVFQFVVFFVSCSVAQAVGEGAQARLDHWAYRPPVEHSIPEVRGNWGISPVDAFVKAKLSSLDLAPSPLADKRTLIRRATFDLIGLPPTFEEVEAFVNDSSNDAYDRLIDRLLASPRYGERWGRHWLDVARYADTQGYNGQKSSKYPFAYTYRDYVVRSFNEDKPYNQFILEQLAADLLEDTKRENLAALGFLTTGERFINKPHEIANDRIDVTTQAFLAMTVGCARCHDHMADPIPTSDYYSLFGVFMSTREPATEELPVIGEPLDSKAHGKFLVQKAKLEKEVAAKISEVFEKARGEWPSVTDGLVDYLGRNHLYGQKEKRDYRKRPLRNGHFLFLKNWVSGEAGRKNPFFSLLHQIYHQGKDARVAKLVAQSIRRSQCPPALAEILRKRKPTTREQVYHAYRDLLKTALQDKKRDPSFASIRKYAHGEEFNREFDKLDKAIMLERNERDQVTKIRNKIQNLLGTAGAPPRAMVLHDKKTPYQPVVFLRGKPGNRGAKVKRRLPQVISTRPEHQEFTQGSGRLELARAIADPANPLTVRVLVNRVWHWHFGRGIVSTPSEFGKMGMLPTHPELLDHLALWFVKNGWSIKKLHRYLMNSTTYRQQSLFRKDASLADEANKFYWRMNSRRLEWEAMRDSILQVSGSLTQRDRGGLPVDPFLLGQKNFRSLYGLLDREKISATLRNFDFPTPQVSCEARVLTSVPQQGLFLMNSEFVSQCAQRLAKALPAEGSDRERVEILFRKALSRDPTSEELAKAVAFLRSNVVLFAKEKSFSEWDALAQAMLLSNEFIYVD